MYAIAYDVHYKFSQVIKFDTNNERNVKGLK